VRADDRFGGSALAGQLLAALGTGEDRGGHDCALRWGWWISDDADNHQPPRRQRQPFHFLPDRTTATDEE
jgi:hypothetical protein